MPNPRSTRGSLPFCGLIIFCLLLTSCSTQIDIPTISDDSVERLVRDEVVRIIAVSEDKDRVADYRIFLSDFPRKDILGMSIGNRRIYINHKLARLALKYSWYRWLLRQTLAHEIAHETAGHAKQNGTTSLNRGTFGRGMSATDVGLPRNVKLHNYSTEKELEADAKGLAYWNKLDWDCHTWVRILKNFQELNYTGDVFHPTDRRLQQAQRLCPSKETDKQPALHAKLPKAQSDRQIISRISR